MQRAIAKITTTPLDGPLAAESILTDEDGIYCSILLLD